MKYTREILEPIVKESKSVSEVCRRLHIRDYGGSNSHISKMIKKFGINTDHFLGRAASRGKRIGYSYPIEDYLSNRRRISSNHLKKRLVEEGFKELICEQCGITHWNGIELSLDLHHIDGDHNNNNLSNVTILCPNCHNIEHKKKFLERRQAVAEEKSQKPDGRKDAKMHLRKQTRPNHEILLKEVAEFGFSAVGRKYNVSDNAIRKWIRTYQKYGQ